MSFKRLGLNLTFGKYLAIAPWSLDIEKVTITQKLYSLVILALIGIVLNAVFWKTKQWAKFIKNLSKIDSDALRKSEKTPFYMGFLIFHLLGGIAAFFTILGWINVFGYKFLIANGIVIIQTYIELYYDYILWEVVDLPEARYKFVGHIVSGQVPPFIILDEIERLLYFLKETVDIFNDIFGWPIAIILLHTCLLLLNYLDYALFYHLNKNTWQIIAGEVVVVLFTLIGTIALIMKCDAVLNEARRILVRSYQLRWKVVSISSKEQKKLYRFTNFVSQNFPEFTAARFLSINRSTILSILGTATTYLIVMLQFHPKKEIYEF